MAEPSNAQLIEQFDQLQAARMFRALETLPAKGQRILRVIPVLLHWHHPALPGYIREQVPVGICSFEPDALQCQYLNDFIHSSVHGAVCAPVQRDTSILALYTMGSTASVGQCHDSDLDIWICVSAEMSNEQQSLLQKKCDQITRWAKSQGIEVSFFVVAEDQFRRPNEAEFGGENCGSTQHVLLLDEFYRSATRLAGRRLLWWLVPPENESRYDEVVTELLADPIVNQYQWLDLGGVQHLSAREYFGASLWQLYKGIDSPYKSVMKAVLLEAYSHAYPATELLCSEAKQRFHAGVVEPIALDGYLLMLQRVTCYLNEAGDEARLQLVRRCFYLKVCDRLSQPRPAGFPAWRRQLMEGIVKHWHWDQALIQHLDHRAHWKVNDVRQAHHELLEMLMQSYRNLVSFVRTQKLDDLINPEDLSALARKLYAAFEELPGKVSLINPQISPDLSEANLTFVEVVKSQPNRPGWYLFNRAPRWPDIIGRSQLEHSSYLSKLVAWTYFNGLFGDDGCNLHLFSQRADIEKPALERFVADIRHTFPMKRPAASLKALSRPCELRQIGLFVNLEVDPTASWDGKVVKFDLRNVDVLSFGPEAQCLIGSIDLIYRNSWNEIRTLHFRGPHALLEALRTLLGKMHQDARAPESIDVFTYSQHFAPQLRNRVYDLVSDCIELRLARSETRQQYRTLRLGREVFGLFFTGRDVRVKPLEHPIDFYSAISSSKVKEQPHSSTRYVPEAVEAYASDGLIQFFFDERPEGLRMYVLDEKNRPEVYDHPESSPDELVQALTRFYTNTENPLYRASDEMNFNLPQFYVLQQNLDHEIEVHPYKSRRDVSAQSTAVDSEAVS